MIEFPLNKGLYALIDDEDYDKISRGLKWYARFDPKMQGYYAVRHTNLGVGKRGIISMHRFVLGIEFGVRIHVDHIDHNTLNNQKTNLRIATASQNFQNRRKMTPKTASKYKGVTWNKRANNWRARIRTPNPTGVGRGKEIFLGHYNSEEEAAIAYNNAAIALFGERALLNNIESI